MPARQPLVISASILAGDFARLGDELRALEAAGADRIHLDVMDGHFVPNLTFGPPVVKSLRKETKLPFDAHLMIAHPERSVRQYVEAGADWVTIHAEATVHLHRAVSEIRALGARPGVAINPATPVESIAHVLHLVDLVLVMSVNPGFAGQSFIAEVIPKMRSLRQLAAERGYGFELAVDGGINPSTAALAAAAGADVLVAASAIFGQSDYRAAIAALRNSATAVD